MKALRLALRVLGWLLTPVVALAASFLAATLGTLVAALMPPTAGLVVTVLLGGVAGFVSLVFWIRLLRRSPHLRQALHVLEDGTPDTAELRADLAETTSTPPDAP